MTTEAVFLILFFTGYSLYSATLSLLAFLIEMSYNANSPPPPHLNKASNHHVNPARYVIVIYFSTIKYLTIRNLLTTLFISLDL